MWTGRRLMWLALTLACNGDDETTPTPTPTGDTGPVLQEDVFVQALITPIDILWVFDARWQEGVEALDGALEKVFETLLLADPSWRIGVLDASISPTDSKFGLIGAKIETYPPPANAFELDGDEDAPAVRQSVYTALELRVDHDSNAEFLRSDADLYILVYTDKEDASDGDVITKADFKSWLEGLEATKSVRLGAVTDSDAKDYWEDQVIGGANVNDVGSFRAAIEKQIRDAIGQKTEFQLTQAPTSPPEEVIVVYREHEEDYDIPEEVTYDPGAHTILFDSYVPPPGAEIHVSYAVTEPGATLPDTGASQGSE